MPTHQPLESRCLLATFVVNTLTDNSMVVDGLVSLREAIVASNINAPFGDAPAGDFTGDAIQFDPSLAGGTISLSNGILTITDDLLIQGGSSGITITTNQETGLFQETSGERVAFGGLTFTNGVAASGGAIKSDGGGTTLVVNSTFENNRATGTGGGAIVHNSGRLNVTNSTFDSNESTTDGGAILSNAGIFGINGGSFTGNVADRGAAVHVDGGDFSSTNATFGDSSSTNSARLGGAISIDGSVEVVIQSNQFNQNEATESGGAIWNTSTEDVRVLDSVFSGNVSLGTGVASDGSAVGGGAIFNEDGAVYIRGSQFDSNQASASGGAILSEDGISFALNSEFYGNSAVLGGGAVENVDGRFVARNSTLGNTGVQANTANRGGAIRNSGEGNLIVNNSTIIGNTAATNGGAIWVSEDGEARIINFSRLSSNVANGSEAEQGGGAIYNEGGRVIVTRSQLTNNEALGELASGGAILSAEGVVLTISSDLTGNAAGFAGGAIDLDSGYFRATGTTFSGNRAGFLDSASPQQGYGGAVAVDGSGTVAVFDSSTLTSNLATEQGGGLWVAEDSLALILSSTSFVSNQANTFSTSRGGAIFTNGRIRGTNFSMTSNESESFGGAIYISNTGSALLESGEFRLNESNDLGGAIFNGNFLNVSDSVFQSNSADDGGAIFTNQGQVLIQNGNQFGDNFPNNTNV